MTLIGPYRLEFLGCPTTNGLSSMKVSFSQALFVYSSSRPRVPVSRRTAGSRLLKPKVYLRQRSSELRPSPFRKLLSGASIALHTSGAGLYIDPIFCKTIYAILPVTHRSHPALLTIRSRPVTRSPYNPNH